MKFSGKIKNGTLKLEDSYGFKDYLFTLEGEVEVEVKPSQMGHSSQQNSYYRVIVRILGKEIGYNEEEMHKTLKEKFDIVSTKDLSKEEFTEYIENIYRWASMDMGIVLPNPTRQS